MATLGELERSVMNLLWGRSEPLAANTVRDLLAEHAGESAHRELATTTVLTVLSRLEKKKLVTRQRQHRPHLYRAATSREEHTAQLMSSALGSAPDRAAVLTRFLGSVSGEDTAILRRLLDEERSKP